MLQMLKERFLKTYANVPLSLRDAVILFVTSKDGVTKRPITWDVAYIEVKHDGEYSEQILKGLNELKLI